MKKHYGIIDMIQPTQHTVGYAEVAIKMEELSRYEKEGTLSKYLKTKTIPCVLGPDNVVYITDHHHMGLALTVLANEWGNANPKKSRLDNPFVNCTFNIEYDFSKSKLERKEFLKVLESLNFLHCYDENGNKTKLQVPRRLIDLKNDSYRSIAGIVRKAGGYNKVNKPYLEFEWADYLRQYITLEEIEADFKQSVIKGISLALSENASHLPGFKGVEILKGLKESVINRIHASQKELNQSTGNLQETIETAKENYHLQKPQKFGKINKK